MKLIEKNYDNIYIAGLLDTHNKPFLFKIQRVNALNYGEITTGKITHKNTTLGGYFIETEKKQPIFVPTHKKFSIGETVTVHVTKEARLGKDATGIISDKSDKSATLSDILFQFDTIDKSTENENFVLVEAIEEALECNITFANGAKIHLERTNVCWTFDVDSAQSTLSLIQINEMACPLIAEHIMLKNLSGLILIDFAGYKAPKDEEKYLHILHQYLYNDPRTKIFGFTKTKLCEIRRTRTTASLFDIFLTPNGKKSPTFLCIEIEDRLENRFASTPELHIHPSVLPHLSPKIKNQCIIKTDGNLQEDEYMLKGE